MPCVPRSLLFVMDVPAAKRSWTLCYNVAFITWRSALIMIVAAYALLVALEQANPLMVLRATVSAYELALRGAPVTSATVQAALVAVERALPAVRTLEYLSIEDQREWNAAIHVLLSSNRLAEARRESRLVIEAALGSKAEAHALADAAYVELHWAKDPATALALLTAATVSVSAPPENATTDRIEPIHGYLLMANAQTQALIMLGRFDEAQAIAERLGKRFPGLEKHIHDVVNSQVRAVEQERLVNEQSRLHAIPDRDPIPQPPIVIGDRPGRREHAPVLRAQAPTQVSVTGTANANPAAASQTTSDHPADRSLQSGRIAWSMPMWLIASCIAVVVAFLAMLVVRFRRPRH